MGPRGPRTMQSPRSNTDLLWLLGTLALLIGWDASGWDLALAAAMGGSSGFPLHGQWFLSTVLHDGARRAAWLPALWLIVGIWWPTGILRRLDTRVRVQWAVSTLLALLAVSALKHISRTSCPWDLAAFGGHAQWVSHWAWGASDGGPGRCFPAGHASAGFAFVTGWFALRGRSPGWARAWLAIGLGTGLLLGVVQQFRGAHFMSHTLWTAWVCWGIAWLADRVFALRALPVPQPAPSA